MGHGFQGWCQIILAIKIWYEIVHITYTVQYSGGDCPYMHAGIRFKIKTVFRTFGDTLIKIRRSWIRLIFVIKIPILVRQHIYFDFPVHNLPVDRLIQ